MKQTFVRLSLVGALALGMSALGAAPGNAATAVQTCTTLKGTATLTPGLTNTPADQTVKAKGTLSGCTPATKTGGGGTIKATIMISQASCTTLINGGQTFKGTAVTDWLNGKVSHEALTFKTGTGNSVTVATITGKVTKGLFLGHLVNGQIKFTVKGTPNCTTIPVTKLSFKNTKNFVIT